MYKKIFIALGLSFSFASCKDLEQKKLVVGEWQCIAWTVQGQPSMNSQNVKFNFKEDGHYEYQNQGLNEKGIYSVQGGKLYSTPENALEIAVDIVKLNQDTFIFDMSRSGTPEQMTLIRLQK